MTQGCPEAASTSTGQVPCYDVCSGVGKLTGGEEVVVSDRRRKVASLYLISVHNASTILWQRTGGVQAQLVTGYRL